MGRQISIIGCGWLGFPLGISLTEKGHTVKGSTTRQEKLAELQKGGIAPFLINLDPEVLPSDNSFFSSEILIVNIPPRNKDAQQDYHKKQLLSIRQLAERNGAKKVVFVSSTGVYPNHNRLVNEQDADISSLSREGVSLLEMEQIFTSSTAFKTTVIRFGGLYGYDRHPGRFLAGKKGLSGADNPVNMIHLDDCIGIIQAVIDEGVWGETFNACSPSHPIRKEFYEKAAIELGVEPPSFSREKKDFKIVSSGKLIERLGYQFKF